MKRIVLAALFATLFLGAAFQPVRADIGTIVTFPGGTNGSVQTNRRGQFYGDSNFTYSTSTHKLTIPSILTQDLTVSTFLNGRCLQAGPGGSVTVASGPCQIGGVSAGSATIVPANQFSLSYYSQPGSSTTLSGDGGILTDTLGNLSAASLTVPTLTISGLASVPLAVDAAGVVIAGPAADVTLAGNQTFTGSNTFNLPLNAPGGLTVTGARLTSPFQFAALVSTVASVSTSATTRAAMFGCSGAGGTANCYGLDTSATTTGVGARGFGVRSIATGTGINTAMQLWASGGSTNNALDVQVGNIKQTLTNTVIAADANGIFISTTVTSGGGGTTTLISSGVAVGSSANAMVSDTNTFVYDRTNYTLHVGSNPLTYDSTYDSSNGYGGKQGLRVWNTNTSNGHPFVVLNTLNSTYVPWVSYMGSGFGLSAGDPATFGVFHSPTGLAKFFTYPNAITDGSFEFDGVPGDVMMTVSTTGIVLAGAGESITVPTVNMSGSGNLSFSNTGDAVPYQMVGSSQAVTVGHMAVFSSSRAIIDGGAIPSGGGGGSGSGTVTASAQYLVPSFSVAGTSNVVAGMSNFSNNGTTITMTGIQTVVQTNVSTVTATGVSFNYTGSTMTVSSTTVAYMNATTIRWADGTIQVSSPVAGGAAGAALASTNTWTAGQTFTSSATMAGAIVFSSNVVLSGSQGSAGQVFTTGVGGAPTWTTLGASGLSSTQTWTGGNTFQSSTTLVGGVAISSRIIVNIPSGVVATTSTLTSTMSVVLASAPANTAWITLTLPSAAANPGLDIMVYKVDGTTDVVKIQGAGTDLIEGSGTVNLNAIYQHASLHSLGAAGWASGLGGIQYTPVRLFSNPSVFSSGFTIASSSTQVICPVYVPVPVSVIGFTYGAGAASGATISEGLLDAYGNMVVSTGPIAAVGSGTRTIMLAQPVNIAPGGYYAAVVLSNTTLQLDGASNNNGGGFPGCSQYTGAVATIRSVTLSTSNTNTAPALSVMVSGGTTTFQ